MSNENKENINKEENINQNEGFNFCKILFDFFVQPISQFLWAVEEFYKFNLNLI